MVSAGDLSAVRVSGQVSWLAAMVKKSRRPLKVAMAATSEGGEGFDLHFVGQQPETFRAQATTREGAGGTGGRDSMSATTLSKSAT
jgi:hypothetical protein